MSKKGKSVGAEPERKRAAVSRENSAEKRSTTTGRSRKRPARAESALETAPEASPVTAGPRRAVFIDVENTTAEAPLLDVLRSLDLDPQRQNVEVTAVGNWRAVPPALGRRLASMGVRLVHSAPARGVRDWSDLWIAAAAGCWLGQARPGDVLEVVSNDRAFDAIGDLAAARGVVFRRISHMRVLAAASGAREQSSAKSAGASALARKKAVNAVPGATPGTEGLPHAAPAEQIIATIEHLTQGEAGRWVNLDVLERALKEQGFVRPPGSPRLVTRLRALRQVEVDAHGRVRIRFPEPPQQAAPSTATG